MGLLRSAALALDKSITRAADTFELTRGRIPSGTCIASLWPRLAGDLISQLENEPVIITGTNGKCTTSRFLAEILQHAGYETLHTQEVAASLDEVISTLVQASNIQGGLHAHYGIFGFDSRMLYEAVSICNPRLFVLNNLYLDGLDFEGGTDALNAGMATSIQYPDCRTSSADQCRRSDIVRWICPWRPTSRHVFRCGG